MTDYKLPPTLDVASGQWEQVPAEQLPQDQSGTLRGWTFAGTEHDEMTFPHVIVAKDAEGRSYAYVSVDFDEQVWQWKASISTRQ